MVLFRNRIAVWNCCVLLFQIPDMRNEKLYQLLLKRAERCGYYALGQPERKLLIQALAYSVNKHHLNLRPTNHTF